MITLSINTRSVIHHAKLYNTDLFTAMAVLTAKEVGIREDEMEMYMEIFNTCMAKSWGHIRAIEAAYMETIMTGINIDRIVRQCIT